MGKYLYFPFFFLIFNIMSKKHINTTPISSQVSDEELLKLIETPYKKKFICWHSWVYWTFGQTTKKHRICKRCYKKQKADTPIPSEGFVWIKDGAIPTQLLTLKIVMNNYE